VSPNFCLVLKRPNFITNKQNNQRKTPSEKCVIYVNKICKFWEIFLQKSVAEGAKFEKILTPIRCLLRKIVSNAFSDELDTTQK